ncbi:trypco2 family protein [Streptomyces canus]|uniref:trypco2 family protein n=1 Tax=Streptomyces canus TaxID=58343 RepID=UPI0030DDE74C
MTEKLSDAVDPTFGLDQVLGALSRDLRAAQSHATEKGAYGLGVAEANVKFSVTVTQEKKRGGGFFLKFNVLGAGVRAEQTESNSSVHTIELKLIPLTQNVEEVAQVLPFSELGGTSGLGGTFGLGDEPHGGTGPSSGGRPPTGPLGAELDTVAQKATEALGTVAQAATQALGTVVQARPEMLANKAAAKKAATSTKKPAADKKAAPQNAPADETAPARQATAKKAPSKKATAKKAPAKKAPAKKSTARKASAKRRVSASG